MTEAKKPTVKGLNSGKQCSKCQVPEGINRLVRFNNEDFCPSCHEKHNKDVMTNEEYNHKSFTIFSELIASTLPKTMSGDVDRAINQCAEQTTKAMKAWETIKR